MNINSQQLAFKGVGVTGLAEKKDLKKNFKKRTI
jgi:hypothetical protein